MQYESIPNSHSRKALFPGSSCPSLSGDGLHDPFSSNSGAETHYDRVDQLNIILRVIGTPDEEELRSVTNPEAKRYLQRLEKQSPQVLFLIPFYPQ